MTKKDEAASYKFLSEVKCVVGQSHQWPAKNSTQCRFCGRHIKWVEGKGYIIKARVSERKTKPLLEEEKNDKRKNKNRD